MFKKLFDKVKKPVSIGMLLSILGCAPIFKNHGDGCYAVTDKSKSYFVTTDENGIRVDDFEDVNARKKPQIITDINGDGSIDMIWFGTKSKIKGGPHDGKTMIYYEPFSADQYKNFVENQQEKCKKFMANKKCQEAFTKWGIKIPYNIKK